VVRLRGAVARADGWSLVAVLGDIDLSDFTQLAGEGLLVALVHDVPWRLPGLGVGPVTGDDE
jgi:hypothetical protein